MSKMEKAVQDLAVALEELSVRAQKSVLASAENAESVAAMSEQADVAKQHADRAALDLASTITGLKAMISKYENSLSAADENQGEE